MNEPTKIRTFGEKIRDFIIIYALPIFCVGYVNYTKCWPYYELIEFFHGTAGQYKGYVRNDTIYFVSVLFFAGIYYGIRYLIKKIL